MGNTKSDIDDYSVIDRILKVERITEQTISNKQRLGIEKLAQKRIELDNLLKETHQKIIEKENNLSKKINKKICAITDSYDKSTTDKIREIEALAVTNRDLTVEKIFSLLESTQFDTTKESGEVP